jgi:prepilin-type N-terminal cleavage/methylation domain-containing protein
MYVPTPAVIAARDLEAAMGNASAARRGFTLLDVMIVVVCLGILASVVIPIVTGHLGKAQDSAAKAQYQSVRRGLDMYFQQHHTWPETIEPELFKPAAEVLMPRGWQLSYDASSGELALVQVEVADLDTAPSLVYVAE